MKPKRSFLVKLAGVLGTAAVAMAMMSSCASVNTPGSTEGTGGRSGGGGGARADGGSGSGSGGRLGGGGQGGGLIITNDGGATCGLQFFDLVRKPAVVMLVLDRSASMKDNLMDVPPTGPNDPTKWSQVVPALATTIPAIGGDLSWAMKVFPEDGSSCAATTVTPKIDFPVTPMGGAALSTAIRAVLPEGNGTPTGPVVGVAAEYLKNLPGDARKYILLATDGQPSCGGRVGALTSGGDAARVDAVAAVTAAAQAGIHTFVLGVATTKTNDVATLNQLAEAGLEPTGGGNTFATKFYLASTQSELTSALEKITGVFTSCRFPLSPPPPVPSKISVKVAGARAPQDPTHKEGWDYTNGDFTEIEVFGSWCEMIRTTAANKVDFVFGCPDIDPPA